MAPTPAGGAPPRGRREVILASASPARQVLLERAGVAVTVIVAGIDEAATKQKCRSAGCDAAATALHLAEQKALQVSSGHPASLVIGADQVLDDDGRWLGKPRDRAEARAQLGRLSGRMHMLVTACCLVCDGTPVWRHVERARLSMRSLDEGSIENYLDAAGPGALSSVGAYQLEGLGAQLFSRVEGDYFAILGLPLLPLLDALRVHGAVAP